jgi:NADH:ubiquinone oxidoreductase subunit 3 (subunit A)
MIFLAWHDGHFELLSQVVFILATAHIWFLLLSIFCQYLVILLGSAITSLREKKKKKGTHECGFSNQLRDAEITGLNQYPLVLPRKIIWYFRNANQ